MDKLNEFEKIRVIVSLIFEKDGKLLLSKQAPDAPRGANYWGFPGGNIELDETIKEATEREAKEELGVEIEFKKVIGYFEYIKAPKHILTIFCSCELKNKNFSFGSDIDKAKWVTKSDVKKYELRPLMKEAFESDFIKGLLLS